MEKKFLDESSLTYLRNYIDGQDKVIYKAAADLVSSTHLESLTRPTIQPTSQLIPSITTTNEQQNLTIGDGLEIENGVLKTTSGGGQAMFDIFQYVDDNMIMTEEGFNLLYDGLKSGKYAGIVFSYWNAYPICIDDTYPLRFQYINFEPESPDDIYKILTIDRHTFKISGLPWDEENQNIFAYSAFYTKRSLESTTNTIPCSTSTGQQNLTIGDGLTIENGVLKTTGGGGSGSSKVWYELPSLFLLENITQEQFNEIKNLVLQNQLAGINCAGLYCPLTFYNDGQNIAFFYPWYENDIFTAYIIRLDADLSVKKITYSTITLPQNTPTSQVIPSITTSNEQQNLTIGNGLEIKDGALQATSSGFNIFDNAFSIGVAENINEETLTLTEIGLNKINNMFANGKLLGVCFEDPANITTDFTFIPFVSFTDGKYWFTGTTYITGTNLQFTQIKINKTTGAIEVIQKAIAATDLG